MRTTCYLIFIPVLLAVMAAPRARAGEEILVVTTIPDLAERFELADRFLFELRRRPSGTRLRAQSHVIFLEILARHHVVNLHGILLLLVFEFETLEEFRGDILDRLEEVTPLNAINSFVLDEF